METEKQHYPALLVDWLTPVYDLFVGLFIPERPLKRGLIASARIEAGHLVLDLGAGTGTLAIMIKRAHPGARVMGIDGDLNIVKIARKKIAREGLSIAVNAGDAAALPYPDGSFDRVLSSLVMSLLSRDVKRMALREAYRVLRSGGEIHIADFGPPHNRWGRMVAPRIRRFEPIADNLDGLLQAMLAEEGFSEIQEEPRFGTLFGTLEILSGRKP